MRKLHYSVMPNNNVVLRAQKPIKKGEEITIQYISFMYGHLRRRKDIKACWFFDCNCQRCLDPTEMGSFMSAVRCLDENCDGDVVPSDLSSIDNDWSCTKCKKR